MPVLQNIGLELQYKTCYARVLDSKRKFLQAATQYYELSQIENVRGGQEQVEFPHMCISNGVVRSLGSTPSA